MAQSHDMLNHFRLELGEQRPMKLKHSTITYFGLVMAIVTASTLAARESHAQDATASKKPKPVPQALWTVNETGNLSIFGGSRLDKKTGTVASNLIGFPNAGAEPEALTFDSQHDLWISLCAWLAQHGLLTGSDPGGIAKPG